MSYHKEGHKKGAGKWQADQFEKRKEAYRLNPKLCKNCQATLPYPEYQKKKIFCNSSCAAKFNNKIKPKGFISKRKDPGFYDEKYGKIECTCEACKNIFIVRNTSRKRKLKFCSTLCYKAWRSENKKKRNEDQNIIIALKAKKKEYDCKYYETNLTKHEGSNKWRNANPSLMNAYGAKRRAMKSRATPAWANKDLIYSFYRMAEVFGLEVDHIIPLNSKEVCGLHVQHNLQLLTPKENRRKGNKLLDEHRGV